MSAAIGSVQIELEARLAKFESDFGRAARILEKEMERMRRQVDGQLAKMSGQMSQFGSKMEATVRGMLGAFSVGALVGFGRHLINTADNINDLSQKFGISTQALSVWRLSAEKSGTSLDGIAAGAKILSKDLADTEVKLRSMGIQLRDQAGNVKPMEAIMEEIAKKVAGYTNEAKKAELMTALFGKAGVDLIPFMNDFGKSVDDAKRRAAEFGAVVGPGLASASDEFNDNVRDMQAALEGVGNRILEQVLPAMSQAAEATAKMLASMRDSGGIAVLSNAIAGLVQNLDVLSVYLASRIAIGAAVAGFTTLTAAVTSTTGAMALLNGAMGILGGPVGLIALAATGLYAYASASLAARDGSNELAKAQGIAIGLTKDEIIANRGLTQELLTQAKAKLALAGQDIAQREKELADAQAQYGNARIRGGADPLVGFRMRLESAKAPVEGLRKSILGIYDALYKTDDQLLEFGKTTTIVTPKLEDSTDAARAAAAAEKDLAKAAAIAARMQGELAKRNEEEEKAVRAVQIATDRYNLSVADTNAALEDELRLAGLFGPEREAAERAVRAHRQALDEFRDSQGTLNQMTEEGLAIREQDLRKTYDEIAARRELTRATEEFTSASKRAVEDAIDGFLDALLRGEDGFKDFGRTLERLGEDMLGNLSRMFRQTVLTPGGGGWSQFSANLAKQAKDDPWGTAIGAVGGAYSGWQNARQGGSALATVGSFVGSGASIGSMIMPGIGTAVGAAVGAVVGILVAAFASKPKPPQIQVGGSGATIDRNEYTGSTAFGAFNVNTVGSGQLPSAEVGQAIEQFDEQIASFLSPAQIDAVTARLRTFETDLKKDAASVEEVLKARFGAILTTFDADVQRFVGGASKFEDQVQRLADAVGAQATFDDLGLDVTFGQFLVLVDDLQRAGETAGATMQRLTGATRIFADALDFIGASVEQTGTDFIRFANDVATAAGGLENATALWDRYFGVFYTADERAQKMLDNALSARDNALATVGLDTGTTLDQFRALFEATLPTLSAEAVVQWLQAANSIANVIDAETALNQVRGTATDSLLADTARIAEDAKERHKDLMELLGDVQWDDFLAGLSDMDRELAETHRRFDDLVQRARDLGATEEQLTTIRNAERNAIDRLTASTQAATDAAAEAADSLTDRYKRAVERWKARMEEIKNAVSDMFDFIRGLALNKQLTTLTPQQQIAKAAAEYQALVAKAQGGDLNAFQSLQSATQTYLELARGFYSSGDIYQTIFAGIQQTLTDLANKFAAIANQPFSNSTPSYDVGSPYIPYDQTARIHQGEMVLDAGLSSRLRRYGITTQSSGSDPETKTMLRELLVRLRDAEIRDAQREERLIRAVEKLSVNGARRVSA